MQCNITNWKCLKTTFIFNEFMLEFSSRSLPGITELWPTLFCSSFHLSYSKPRTPVFFFNLKIPCLFWTLVIMTRHSFFFNICKLYTTVTVLPKDNGVVSCSIGFWIQGCSPWLVSLPKQKNPACPTIFTYNWVKRDGIISSISQ